MSIESNKAIIRSDFEGAVNQGDLPGSIWCFPSRRRISRASSGSGPSWSRLQLSGGELRLFTTTAHLC